MDLHRRSKPVWRSVIGPVSLGLLWPSILGAFWFYILTEFGNPLTAEAVTLPALVQQVPAEQPPLPAPSFVRDDSVPSHARLRIGEKLVVDAPLTHMGHVRRQPDGTLLAFDLFPAGTETMGMGQIHIFDMVTGDAVAVMAGHAPVWNDQAQLEFTTPDQTLAIFDLNTGQQTEMSALPEPEAQEEILLFTPPDPDSSFSPTSIRVRHHPQNYCRQGVAENEVTELPLEEYVARVLPAEVPPSWELEALKAVAIAARTYAWNKIYQNLSGTYPYDVTDWANNQVMCDYRHARSDQAVEATAGVIIQDVTDPSRLPILSMYSAENAHPTKQHSYLAYLASVPDPNALGRERRGHGWGLSQLGAQRFAKQGLSFCQILGHYYSDIHISSAMSDAPLGCLVVNGASGFATGAGLHIEAVVASHVTDLSVEINDVTPASTPVWAAYNPAGDVALAEQAEPAAELVVVAFVPPEVTGTDEVIITAAVPVDAAEDSPDQSTNDAVATATPEEDTEPVAESPEPEPTPTDPDEGNPDPDADDTAVTPAPEEDTEPVTESPEPTPTDPVTEPAPENGTPADTESAAWPVTLALTSSSHVWFIPRETLSGTILELKLLSGTQVLDTVRVTVDYEGPEHVQASLFETDSRDHLLVEVAGASGDGFSMGHDWSWEQNSLQYAPETGALAQDPLARDGLVWLGDPEQHKSGTWFGPYTSVLPGEQSYRALFRLKMPGFAQVSPETMDATQPVARLDVTQDLGKKVLGFRELYLTDFLGATDFASFGVDFHLFASVPDLEFRVHWYGTHALALDQVTVVSYPFRTGTNTHFTWPVVPDTPVRNLRFAAFDEADNMSTLFTLNLNQRMTEPSAVGSNDDCHLFDDCVQPPYPSAIE